LALLCAFSVQAQPGLDWLATQQNVDGSHGGSATALATPGASTAEVLRAQLALQRSSALGFDSALSYLNARSEADTELLSRKVVVNAAVGIMSTAAVSQLLGHQNADGGFGARPGHDSSVYDTAFAVEALAAANYLSMPQAAKAVGFLLSRQQGSGGWADGANGTSTYLTAASVRALWPYRSTYQGVAAALTLGQNHLVSQRGPDGLWGEDFLSATVLLAVLPGLADLSVIEGSDAALRARQLPNGSWVEDPYTTALALRALQAYDARKSGSTPTPAGSITGYVAKAGSTEPIEGATVSVTEVPGVAVLTNAEGYFVVPGLPAGTYTLTATRAGFTSASVVVTARAHLVTLAGTLVLDVASQSGLVRGTVFDAADQQPLPSVQVTLAGPGTYSVLTSRAGEFDFGAVAPGTYTLRFEKAGYNTLSGTATVVAGQTLSTQLGMTLAGGYVDDAPGTVRGRVVDGKTGQPLAGAVFSLGGGLSATSAADGTFQVHSVPRATYAGTVSASSYQTLHFNLVFSPGASGELGTVSLFKADTTPPPTTLTLHGLVSHGVTGAPLAGATVALVESGATATTGADGRFTFSGITLKRFNLTLSASGFNPASYTIEVAAFGDASVELTLSPPGSSATSSMLAGVVSDAESGAPISGARVSIPGTSLSVVTDSAGHYSLSGITSLEFVVGVSAVGYGQQSSAVKLAAHGSYTLNPTLNPVAADSFQVISVSASPSKAGANGTVLFQASIASLLSASKPVLVLGEVMDAAGTHVATLRPYAPGTNTPASQFVFDAGETKELTLPWSTGQFAPGLYRLVLRVVEPGTIDQASPTGDILAEGSTYAELVPTVGFGGAVIMDPPLTQSGLSSPVSFTALVRNLGNQGLPEGLYVLTVVHPDTGSTLFTAEAPVEALNVGGTALVGFGSWVPTAAGNLQVRVRAKDAALVGELTGRLYVGDKASGTFTVDRSVVPEGTQTVRGRISMQGVDTRQGGSTDPLFDVVKEAVKRGGAYTAPGAISWHQTNQCLGCHTQTQSLLGLSSSFDKAPVDRKAAQFLYNAISTSQWADGALRISHPEFTRTQTTLGLWSLDEWPDVAGTFRTKYKAARFLFNLKARTGDQTYWWPDHATGWWNTHVSHTALTVKGFANVLEDASKLDLTGLQDYALAAGRPTGAGAHIEDMVVGPDGGLYIVKHSGQINRMDLTTGAVTVAAGGLPSALHGLAIAPDGTMFVTRSSNPTLIKIRPDGTRENLSLGGYLTDAAFGPDGLLYLVDWSGRRILRMNPAGGPAETIVSGGLLYRPYGLLFDADGNLLVSNLEAYNILKVTPDRQVSIFSEGLAYRPVRMAMAADGSVFASTYQQYTDGLIRVRPDGSAERVVQQGGLYSVVSANGQIHVANISSNTLHAVDVQTLDTAGLADLRNEIPRAARYFLGNYQDNNSDNTVHALRLIGMAEARAVVEDSALRARLDTALAHEETLLRSRQRADGGWGRYVNYPSDPLTTAMVGIALEYRDPSPVDPQIRKTILYLLNTQLPDGSWDNVHSGLSTRLASTSFVMIFMPKALERLGGIDLDLRVELPANVQLANPTLPATARPVADGGTEYSWRLLGVTGSGRDVEFDLTLRDLALGEQRPVARKAYMEFTNSFVDEKVQVALDIPVVRASSGLTLAVTTDKAEYPANEPVLIGSTVKNTGPAAASGKVVLAIRAPGASEFLAELPPLSVDSLASGAQRLLQAAWNTGTTFPGDYEVYGRLLDAGGRVLAEGVAPFKIVAPQVVATTAVSTDRPLYGAWDGVRINGRVRNVAPNAALAPSRVELTVKTPGGDTLSFETRDLHQLMPGALVDLPFSLKLSDAASGTYPVTLVLQDAFTREVLSTSTTSFQVVRRAMQGLSGTVTVASPQVYVGDSNACTETARNASASAVPGVKLTHQLVNVDTGTLLDEVSQTVTLAGGGKDVSVRDVSTHGLVPGGYACILQAEVDGEARTLGSAGFRVVEPPIKLSAALSVGGKGRLLVLLDASTDKGGADPFGPASAPGLSAQRAFLEELLTRAGWSYTLTESADAFTREFHTGGYAAYAFFSEQEKLSEQTQRELREAVFRGEGLLVAGAHDERQHGLDDALGVKALGNLTSAERVVLQSSEFPLLTGELGLLAGDKVRRVKRSGAVSLGVYRLAAGAKEPVDAVDALTLNSYGRGEAALAGVDLLAMATRDGQTGLAAQTLRALLERVHPETLSTGPGAVVPVQLAVTNEGIAVPVTATVSLPPGVTVVDPGTGVGGAQGVTFQFPLAVDEVKTVRLWVRLPALSGSVTLGAVVSAGQGSQVVTVTSTVTLAVVPPEMLGALQSRLDALVRSGHPDAKALAQASRFVAKGLASADPRQGIPDILKATDALAGLTEPRVVDLRVALGVWLRWAAQGA
jgi:streptogramin lyase